MKISKEMEKFQREVSKGIVEDPEDTFKDDYFEHPEGRMSINIDKVPSDEEK